MAGNRENREKKPNKKPGFSDNVGFFTEMPEKKPGFLSLG
jgi:hypothetical protein